MPSALLLVLLLIGGLCARTVKYTAMYNNFHYTDNTLGGMNGGHIYDNPVNYYPALASDTIMLVMSDYVSVRNPDDTNYTIVVHAGPNNINLTPGFQGRMTSPYWNTSVSGFTRFIRAGIKYFVSPPADVPKLAWSPLFVPTSHQEYTFQYLANNLQANAYCLWNTGKTCGYSSFRMSMYIRRINGNPDQTRLCIVPSAATCMQCAWPYYAAPDTSGCGCSVNTKKLQSKNSLAGQCNAFCNSSSINGNQAYIDYSRSNFDVEASASIRCACSDPITRKTIYRPTTTCPTGSSSGDDYDGDSTQPAKYDPSTPAVSDTGAAVTIGSGGSDTTLARILGDTAGWRPWHDKLDTLGDSGSDSSHGLGDTGVFRDSLSALGNDSVGTGISDGLRDSGSTWSDWHILDTNIEIRFMGHVDTAHCSLGTILLKTPVPTVLPIVVRVATILAMWSICFTIAMGSTGKDNI